MAEPALNYLGLKVLLLPFYVSWYNVSFDVKADNVLYFFVGVKKSIFILIVSYRFLNLW
jgi:hypothetical protein